MSLEAREQKVSDKRENLGHFRTASPLLDRIPPLSLQPLNRGHIWILKVEELKEVILLFKPSVSQLQRKSISYFLLTLFKGIFL
ncbi:hypothetical protein TNCV_1517341 [Trichonephila clavipes]|nr:hypothetical protein TNCV_1517341 [Trichonephila clavipes]